jgi:hypothetical protein
MPTKETKKKKKKWRFVAVLDWIEVTFMHLLRTGLHINNTEV